MGPSQARAPTSVPTGRVIKYPRKCTPRGPGGPPVTPPGPPGTPPPEGGPQGGPQGGQRRGEPRCSGRSLRSTHGSLRAPSASGIWPAAATPGYNMPPSRDHVVRDRTPLLRSSVPCGPPVAPHRLPPLSLRSELPQPGRLGCSCIRSGGPATLRRPPAGVAVALLVASRWVSLGAFARRFAYRHHFPHRHRPQSPQGGSLGPLALSEVSLPWRNSPRCQGPPGPRHQRLTGARTPEIARLRPISSGNPREPRRRPNRLLGPNWPLEQM